MAMLQLPHFSDAFLKAWNDFVSLATNPDGTMSAAGLQELQAQQQRIHEQLVAVESLLSIEDPVERHFEWPIDATEESLRADRQLFEDRGLALEMILSSIDRGEVPPRVPLPSDVTPEELHPPRPLSLHEKRAITVAKLVVVYKRSLLYLHELEYAVGMEEGGHPLSGGSRGNSLEQVFLNGKPLFCNAGIGAPRQLRRLALRQTIDNCIAWCKAEGIVLSPTDPEP